MVSFNYESTLDAEIRATYGDSASAYLPEGFPRFFEMPPLPQYESFDLSGMSEANYTPPEPMPNVSSDGELSRPNFSLGISLPSTPTPVNTVTNLDESRPNFSFEFTLPSTPRDVSRLNFSLNFSLPRSPPGFLTSTVTPSRLPLPAFNDDRLNFDTNISLLSSVAAPSPRADPASDMEIDSDQLHGLEYLDAVAGATYIPT